MKTFVPKHAPIVDQDGKPVLPDPITFDLAGDVYSFQPGVKKSGPLLGMLHVNGKKAFAEGERAKAMLDWFAEGLNREHNDTMGRKGHPEANLPKEECSACHLQRRLLDPDDYLDLETVMEVVNWLMGQVSGRPTTSPSGS
jgi:hypothetical protein